MPFSVHVSAETVRNEQYLVGRNGLRLMHKSLGLRSNQVQDITDKLAALEARAAEYQNQTQMLVERQRTGVYTATFPPEPKPCPGMACGYPCGLPDGHEGAHVSKPSANAQPELIDKMVAHQYRAQWSQEQQRANRLSDECGSLATELKNERARCRELERKIDRLEGRR